MAFEITRQEILKQAIELKKLYDSTRIQSYKDQELRLRRIVVELDNLTLGASDLNSLTDVTISAPANAQVLAYNSTTSQWENQTPSPGGGGDMLKSTYDVDNDGIVDGSETTQIIVRNSTGSTLTKGQVVYLSGATGNRPNAVLSKADTEATSSKTIGIVVANIANNSDGFVAVNGTLHNLDTSAFAAGDAVWLSAATAGAFTSTIPAEPNHTVFIGFIARSHPTQGRLVLHIQNGYELNELHGVLVTSEANNDLLVYESSTTLWKNKSISTIFGGTPLVSVPTLAQVTTAGNTTANSIVIGSSSAITSSLYTLQVVGGAGGSAIFSNSAKTQGLNINLTTAGETRIYGDYFGAGVDQKLILGTFANRATQVVLQTSGNVSIGTTTDAGYKLDVNGTARVQGNIYLTDQMNRYIYGFGGSYIKFYDSGTGGLDIYNLNGTGATRNYGPLEVYGNFSTTGSFSMNGNLNIGNGNFLAADGANLNRIYPYNGANGNMRFVLGHPTAGDFDWEYPINTVLVRLKRNGNFLIGTTTDAGYKLDVNGTIRATSLIRNGGTALQYLLADGSVRTTTADTNFIRYGDYITGKNYPGVTASLNAQVIRDDFYGFNARWTQTDTYTGTYPNAGSTWIRTYELITGENYVYPYGNMYFGFWTNYPPANITVRTWSPTAGVWQGPYTGSDIRIGGGGFAFWKVPISGNNYVTKFEVTFTPQPGLSINLQSQDLIIDYAEGVDYSPIVSRSGSSMYGALSFKTATATNVTISTNGVVNLLYLRPSNSSGLIEFQNSAGTKAGSMFMDGTIWRFKAHASADTLNIFANGNLGIRQTTDAGYAFDVNGTSRLNGAVTATLANVSTANVVYYNSSTGLMTYATAPVGAQFKIDYDPNITGTKNGSNLLFTTSSTFIATTTRVFLNGQRLTRGATYDYVETGTNQITFAVAPVSTDQLIIEYQI